MQACSQESQGGAVTVASEKTMTDLRAGAFMFSAFAAHNYSKNLLNPSLL